MPSLRGKILSKSEAFTFDNMNVQAVGRKAKLPSTPLFKVNERDEIDCLSPGVEFTLQGEFLCYKHETGTCRAQLVIGQKQLEVYLSSEPSPTLPPMKILNETAEKQRRSFR